LQISGLPIARKSGHIIEVNAAPGIRMHHFPNVGKAREVGKSHCGASLTFGKWKNPYRFDNRDERENYYNSDD